VAIKHPHGRPRFGVGSGDQQHCQRSRHRYLVNSATSSALSAPDAWTLGNTLPQDWIYSSPLARLSRLKVGSGTPASTFDRSYTYDNDGNVATLADNKSAANSQSLGPLKR
jgi:hypothetical protein